MTTQMPFSRTEPEHEPAVLDGWEIGRLLARRQGGASYEVYKSNGDVAALTLSAEACDERRERSRLRRLTRLRASLVHPHMLRVHSTGELGGRPYLITELPPELTMESLGAPLAPKTCVRMLAEAASALDAAHELGLVHQSLGADSLLLRSSARHVLLDEFGLTTGSTKRERPDVYLALNHRYAPPEVVRGELPSARSNVYSLACMLFEGLTGAAPFDRGHPAWVEAYAHVSEAPPLASERRHDIPVALDDVLARGLAKDPEERPESAGELIFAAARALKLAPPAAIAHLRPALPARASAPPAKRVRPGGGAPARAPARRERPAPTSAAAQKAPAPQPGSASTRGGRTGGAGASRASSPSARAGQAGSRDQGSSLRAAALALALLVVAAVTGFAIGGQTSSESPEPAPRPKTSSVERSQGAAALRARQEAIRGLDAERRAGRSALAEARTPRGQARAAQRLERAHESAAARLSQAENAPLRSAMEATGAAYAALGRAAERGDRADYRAARRAVGGSETRLQEAIEALRRS
jgi:serine/threonine protein kinase